MRNKHIASVSGLAPAARKLPGFSNLTSIKGIEALGASVLLSVIGDVEDFREEGKLASYFGIVPRVQNSNETQRLGHITKRGSKLSRPTLVQCALLAKRYSPYLNRFYERIRARRGTGKAVIALAREFLGTIYHAEKQLGVRRIPQLRTGGSQGLTTNSARPE